MRQVIYPGMRWHLRDFLQSPRLSRMSQGQTTDVVREFTPRCASTVRPETCRIPER